MRLQQESATTPQERRYSHRRGQVHVRGLGSISTKSRLKYSLQLAYGFEMEST